MPKARAAPFLVTLEYEAAAGCPDASEFKAWVAARLGHNPFAQSSADYVHVRIEQHGVSVSGEIEWRDPAGRWKGEQSFPPTSTDCDAFVRAVSFALAAHIRFLSGGGNASDVAGASAEAGRTGASVTPEHTGALEADSRQSDRPAPKKNEDNSGPTEAVVTTRDATTNITGGGQPAPAGARPQWVVGAGPSVGLGMAPSALVLGRVFAGLLWQRVAIELGAAASLPVTTRRQDGAGIEERVLLASAAACAVLTRWQACLRGNIGEMALAGRDIEHPTSIRTLLVQAGARIGVVQQLGTRLFMGAHCDGLVVVTRGVARLDEVPVWTSPRFAATVGLDAGVRFP